MKIPNFKYNKRILPKRILNKCYLALECITKGYHEGSSKYLHMGSKFLLEADELFIQYCKTSPPNRRPVIIRNLFISVGEHYIKSIKAYGHDNINKHIHHLHECLSGLRHILKECGVDTKHLPHIHFRDFVNENRAKVITYKGFWKTILDFF